MWQNEKSHPFFHAEPEVQKGEGNLVFFSRVEEGFWAMEVSVSHKFPLIKSEEADVDISTDFWCEEHCESKGGVGVGRLIAFI